jgi:tRNA (mo5U34)-methyltransferase
MTSAQLAAAAKQSRVRLTDARRAVTAALKNHAFEWYPYDSLANLSNLEKTLGPTYLAALDSAPGKTVADIGCGDGDLSFFLEQLGCTVDAIDFPDSNHNGMQGVRALKRHLNSSIGIAEVDLDNQFTLPRAHYDLVVFLGILYHLKNPLYVMERLARHTRYCIVSTRVARYFPDHKPMPQGQPIAYLVGEDELNRDASNFWIFSHTGLKRLFERTSWKLLAYGSVGDTTFSAPVGDKRDERVFCLLESHWGMAHLDLLQGWHQPGTEGARWTAQTFVARVHLTTVAGPDRLRMRVYVPEFLLDRFGPLHLQIDVDGEAVAPALFDTPGHHDIVRRFPTHGHTSVVISCKLDHALPPDAEDARERGLVVVSLTVE